MRGAGLGAVGAALFLLCGCAAEKAPAARVSEAMQRSRAMLAQLDRVEADLHEENLQLETWGELKQRHQQVTQVTCQVSDAHVREIHRLEVAQQEKRAEKLRKRRVTAMASSTRNNGALAFR